MQTLLGSLHPFQRLGVRKASSALQGMESSEEEVPGTEVFCKQAIPSEIPQHQKYSRGWSTKCKEGIKNVTSLLHIVDDVDSLKETYALIQECINILSKAANKEDGIINS